MSPDALQKGGTMSTPAKWGKGPDKFIHDLKDQYVLVSLSSGKSFRGQLVGADPYNLVLRQSSGLELMISKGQMIYIHATNSGE
jgi:small nuclear ribonucleoprotein (snRNP)-like protein